MFSAAPDRRWSGGADGSTEELGVQADVDAGQGLGDGAPFLGLLGVLLERRLVDPRHLGLVVELDAGDLEALAYLLQVDFGRGGDALRIESRAAETGRQRHRKAAGVRGADQLFGIGPLGFLEARAEGVRPFESAAPQGDLAVTLFQIPFPDGVGFADRHSVILLDYLAFVVVGLAARKTSRVPGGSLRRRVISTGVSACQSTVSSNSTTSEGVMPARETPFATWNGMLIGSIPTVFPSRSTKSSIASCER